MNNPPHINEYWHKYPHKVLRAYAQSKNQSLITNSRLGHMEISAGRYIPEDLEIINESISTNNFYRNKVLLDCFKYARDHNSNIHFLGLLSDAGINSHIKHLFALLETAYRQNFTRVYVDAIIDGIDTKSSALKFVEDTNNKFREIGFGNFSSITGRHWAMRSQPNVDQIKKVYELLVNGQGSREDSAQKAITNNLQKGLKDQDLIPTLIKINDSVQTIKKYDCVIVFNFRADRMKPLVQILTGMAKKIFWQPQIPEGMLLATFKKYSRNFTVPVIFPREPISDTLPEVFARYQKTNLRLAESLKKPHVTYYFNGGRSEPLAGEERKIVDSPRVTSYDRVPELAGGKIVQEALRAITSNRYDFILINFANADIAGHIGNISAAGKAVLALDKFVSEIVDANLKVGGATILTADHGNVEQMIRDNSSLHTKNPVPFILIAKDKKKTLIQGALGTSYSLLSKIVSTRSTLADVAPTILELMNLPKPKMMTGHSLLKNLE